MHMSIWWGSDLGEYLFPGLNVQTVGALCGTCFVVAIMSFLFEFLRYLQAKHRQKELKLRARQLRTICPTDSSTLLPGPSTNPLNITLRDRSLLFGAELSLWFLLQNLGYVLMLSVMIMNGWVFVAAVLGGGLGHLLFGLRFMKVNLQNCKIMRDTFCMPKCGDPASVASERDGESTPALESPSTSQMIHSCHQEVTDVHAHCDP